MVLFSLFALMDTAELAQGGDEAADQGARTRALP